MTSRRVVGGSVRESSADQPLLTALNQLQPTYVRSGGQAELLPDWLLDPGTLLNICASITGACCGWKLCVLDFQLDQKIDGASLLHSCMRGRLRVIPWKLACTACCTAQLYNLVWTSFALRTLA
jgi:hypothetical protein